MHRAAWRQEIDNAETLAARPAPVARTSACYVCLAPATQLIESNSQRFRAPRCDEHASELLAYWRQCGVKDVRTSAIRQPEPVAQTDGVR